MGHDRLSTKGARVTDAGYAKSEAQLERARRTIPRGSRTYWKSVNKLPLGASPAVAAGTQG